MSLFQGDTYQIPGRAITGLPANQAWIALPDPTQTAGENWTAFCVIRGHFVAALRGMAKFRSWDHDLLMGEVNEEIRQKHVEAAETALGEYQSAASKPDARRMGRINRTGAWLSVLSSTVNGAELRAQEWRDYLFLRYCIEPPDLSSYCNGCGAALSI